MTDDQNRNPNDPRTNEATPPYPKQQQDLPGSEQKMDPKPDHGEDTYQGHGRLEGKVALITGADSGIGKAVAIAYAREGADVIVSYLSEHKDARETQQYVEQAGRKCLLIPGDISNEEHCIEMVQRTVREFGRIDVLVNNAAYMNSRDHITDIPSDEWLFTLNTNISAMFYICKAAVPHMPPGSSIINTSSVQAYEPSPFILAYATTKGAIVTFTKGLAQMLAKQGIRVNTVAPGPIWTPFIPAGMPSAESVSKFGQQAPLKRAGQPKELAPMYVLLASDEGSYMTNGVYPVSGGELSG